MTKHKRISELLNGGADHKTMVVVAAKARKSPKRLTLKPSSLKHYLALIVYDGIEQLEILFIDNITVFSSYTRIDFGANQSETYVATLAYTETTPRSTIFYYKNNTSLEIIRIS